MDSQDPNQPKRPDEEPTRDDPPTEGETPAVESPAPSAGTTEEPRLFRSRTDRMLAGVSGGLGRHLGVDPVLLRIGFVLLALFGGAGLVAYVLAALLIPNEPEVAPAGAAGPGNATRATQGPDRGRTLTIVGLVILLLIGWPLLLGGGLAFIGLAVPLAILALIGLVTWWIVSGEAPGEGPGGIARRSALGVAVLIGLFGLFVAGAAAAALGSGAVAAIVVIVAGLALVGGAIAGHARALIFPALALALGVGFVSAAGIELDGGVGERSFAPTSATDLAGAYELGAGELVVDLRDADLPPGDTPLAMDIGMGEATLIVPAKVCVATTASVGMGNVSAFGRDHGGVDVEFEDLPSADPDKSRVVVNADVGFGEFRVAHEPIDDRGPFRGGDFRFDGPPVFDRVGDDPLGNVGCAGSGEAASAGA